MKDFTAWIPATINIDDIIKEHPTKLKRDKLLYIIHTLRTVQTEDRRNMVKGEWVLLNAEVLKAIISNYKEYLVYLEAVGLIQCDGKYKPDVRSNGYKFTSLNYIAVPSKKISLTDWTLLSAIDKAWKKDHYGTEYVKRHLPYLYKPFYDGKLSIRIPEDTQLSHTSDRAVDSIRNGKPRLSVDKFGRRLHTPLTRLKGELRQYLRYEDKELMEVDIKCSQPYLSVKYIMDDLSSKYPEQINQIKTAKTLEDKLSVVAQLEKCEGLYAYLSDIFVDDLYLKLKEIWEEEYSFPIGLGEREDYKVIMFETLYSHNRSSSKAKDIFITRYPYPNEILHKIKRRNHKDLSKKLQMLESSLLLKTICKRIYEQNKSIPLFTIHDSILTTHEHIETVTRITKEVLLESIGFEPILISKNS